MDVPKPPSWWMWLVLTGFMGGILLTLINIGITSSGANADMLKSILTVATINGVLCMMIAGMGHFSVAQSPFFKQPYIFFMLHTVIIISVIGVCVSSLRQLGIDPTNLPSPAVPTSPTEPPTNLLQVALGLGSTGFALGIISIATLIYMSRKTV